MTVSRSEYRALTVRDRRHLGLLWLLVGVTLLTLVGCKRHRETGLNPGDIPPSFELTDLSGKSHTLSELRGKVVLLNFWASWCQPCVAELPSLQVLHDKFKDRGLVVVGIGIDDDKQSLTDFQQKLNLTFPILIDLQGFSKGKFRVSGVPESFFIDREGRLVLFSDPESDAPAVRIIGPRDWSSTAMIEQVTSLLKEDA